jgi:hypothetical protein
MGKVKFGEGLRDQHCLPHGLLARFPSSLPRPISHGGGATGLRLNASKGGASLNISHGGAFHVPSAWQAGERRLPSNRAPLDRTVPPRVNAGHRVAFIIAIAALVALVMLVAAMAALQ